MYVCSQVLKRLVCPKEFVVIRKLSFFLPLILLSIVMLSCSSQNSTSVSAAIPNVSGAWEFQASSSSNSNTFTGIEVALKEGQIIVNGMQQPNGQISASGASQIAVVSVNPNTPSVVFGGSCPQASGGAYDLNGSVASLGGPVTFTYTENGNAFNVTGTLSGDGKSFLGTYTSASSTCVDSGSISGSVVPKLTGTYDGQFTLPDGTSENVTLTLTESSSGALTANVVGTSPITINFTLTGPVTGNAFSVQGTYQSQQVTYEGYFGVQVLDPVLNTYVSGVYLVNATNPANPIPAGTLIPPST